MTAIPKINAVRDPDHLKGFQHRECFARGLGGCSGDVVGHHILMGWNARGYKPHDYWTIALCNGHHTQLHNGGEHRFWGELFNEDRQALTEVLRAYAEQQYDRR